MNNITNKHLMYLNRLKKMKAAEKRAIQLKELQMWSYIRHLMFYSCFLCILYIVSYTNRNPNAYQQVHHLRNYFLNPNNATYNFMKVFLFLFLFLIIFFNNLI